MDCAELDTNIRTFFLALSRDKSRQPKTGTSAIFILGIVPGLTQRSSDHLAVARLFSFTASTVFASSAWGHGNTLCICCSEKQKKEESDERRND